MQWNKKFETWKIGAKPSKLNLITKKASKGLQNYLNIVCCFIPQSIYNVILRQI